ncbi:protocadherin beta-3-like [Mizuhopecten yessoensis]|uniref:Protocadherin-20 n=1 Tax=Mizuhopecten yessoensis TaxID=6573 RepID=A0A210PLD8_MIZYE|nr:protocadherin beta-3-like [Mizuhopecten yessoensis]OWF37310.1 Protocadherin-11 X-linked [Mizuhopecten yessoensis]
MDVVQFLSLDLFLICVLCTCMVPGVGAKDVAYFLAEEEQANFYLGNVAADADLASEATNPADLNSMKYSFLTQSNNNEENSLVSLFHINERQSSLYTAQQLDRENLCEYKDECVLELEVIARSTSGSLYKKIKVSITLLDINDNSPSFSVPSITRDISEGSLTGFYIPIEAAKDADTGNFSIQYYILEPPSSPFTVGYQEFVDGTYSVRIVLDGQLDRETTSSYKVNVIARDGGEPPKTGVLEVIINVLDINDNRPRFNTQMYNVTVNEDVAVNTTITTVFADDPDQGENGRVTYKLSPNQAEKIPTLFTIDESSGDVIIVGSLIYEPGKSYTIIVEASDNALQPLISQSKVFIHVLDVHNNPPEISIDPLSNTEDSEILENAILDTAVAHITIFDPDTGKNGIVNCSVVNSDKFTLQRFAVHEYKVVLSQALNREIKDRYEVTVHCHDIGTPQLNASAMFVVHVMDINDNTPKFTQQQYFVSVQENKSLTSSVMQVAANDFDNGKNAEVMFSLDSEGQKYFRISETSGVITVNSVLDRETVSQISFSVFAADKGSPSLTGSAQVRMIVTDVNDNKPEFMEDTFEYNLEENNHVNINIGVLVANDKDDGNNSQITYSIHPNYHAGIPFAIMPNGSILATQVIDREAKARYDFTVIAEDMGNPSLRNSAHVTVFVLDVNDNNPEFVFPNAHNNTVVISYQTPVNTIVSTVETRDIDEGMNSRVTYFMKDKNFSHIFKLNNLSGRIVLDKALTVADAKKYTFGIIAQDKGTPPRINEIAMSIVVTTQKIGGDVTPPEVNRQYFLIAVAISCVTAVIAIVIILTICLIKRADRIKQRYSETKDNSDGPLGRQETRKKVSFSIDDRAMTTMPGGRSSAHENHLYPEIPAGSIQVSLKNPDRGHESDSGQGSLDSGDRRHHQLTSLQLHHALLTSPSGSKNRSTVSHMSPPLSGLITHQEADNHSDLSGEANTSDSGRGGSDDDLNTSCILSYSGDFDHLAHSPRGKHTPRGSSKSAGKREELFPLPEHDYGQLNHMKPTLAPLSFGDRFFNYESNQGGLSPVKFGGVSPTGNSFILSGNDDSTTTSGSYVLDHEDDYVDVVRPSRQCIV